VLPAIAVPVEASTPARRSPLRWVSTLYLAQGMPFYAVNLVAVLVFKDMGITNDLITYWTGLLGLAWAVKPLWSPLLESAPSKKRLVVIFQALGGVALALTAFALNMPAWFGLTLGALALVSIASATHDIASDGLYIDSLNARKQAEYAGWQSAFFTVAKLVSLGGLVYLAGVLERSMPAVTAWTIIFCAMAAIMALLAAYHLWALPDPRSHVPAAASRDVIRTYASVVMDFFRKPGVWFGIAFIFLFRAGEGQLAIITPLFLRDARAAGGLGMGNDQIGIVYGTFGTMAFLVGSIAGGYFAAWRGLRRAMPYLIVAMNMPNIIFWWLSMAMPSDAGVVVAALSLETFGFGFGIVGLTLFIMQYVAAGRYTTAHYALGTGIMQVSLMFFKMISGKIQTHLGYQHFFLLVVASALPVLIMSFFLKRNDLPADEAAPVA
jgi:PAT family beta-lactamase induction signal transducer AmpG